MAFLTTLQLAADSEALESVLQARESAGISICADRCRTRPGRLPIRKSTSVLLDDAKIEAEHDFAIEARGLRADAIGLKLKTKLRAGIDLSNGSVDTLGYFGAAWPAPMVAPI